MRKLFQRMYALSAQGADNLIKSIAWSSLMNLSFMLPAILAFQFLDGSLQTMLTGESTHVRSIGYYALMSAVAFAIMFIIAYFQYQSTYTKIYEESARRRINLAETLRKLPLAFFGKKDVADLSSTIMEDATQIEQLFSHAVPQIFASVVTVALMAVLLFVYNWQLALALFWVVPVAMLVFFLSKKHQSNEHTKMYHIKRDISDVMQEGFESVHEIKAYNRESDYCGELNQKLDGYEKHLVKSELVLGAMINVSYIILQLGLPTVLLTGAYLVVSGSASILTYIAFMIIASRIYNPLMEVMNNLAMLIYLAVRIRRMKEMDAMPRQEGRTNFKPGNFDITFENVDFSYLEGVQTLKNVSFTAKQGEVTALVGPSGGGKSTVAKLAARFWDIDRGKITLGGIDVSQIDPETLLKHYSIVFQDVTLFNTSIMENIRLGKKDASDQEVMRAARLAQCDDFINHLPQGYETLIGENGERLSGGERQRISIARAILKDAPIILLDEATASLDAENESKIQRALSALIENKTVLVIAHRMRTIINADHIIVIKDGEIAENGAPTQLRKAQGMFASMLHQQQSA